MVTRQFDVVKNRGSTQFPYLLVVQHDLLSELNTRLVVPLATMANVRTPLGRLTPVLEVEGRRLVALTHLAGAVRTSKLGPVVASLAEQRASILAAVDMLLTGV